MFNYDWFNGAGLQRMVDEASRRCAARQFPDVQPDNGEEPAEYVEYLNSLEARVILYLKDGLSYEMKDMADLGTSSALAFECQPVDESYKVGTFIVLVPFEDIARVEVFTVHPDDKPQENLRIPGFRAAGNQTP
jgi:hypothetical protein